MAALGGARLAELGGDIGTAPLSGGHAATWWGWEVLVAVTSG